MNGVIHLNNAGASLPSDQTLNVMIDHLRLEQEVGGYEAAAQKTNELADFYDACATLVGCEAEQIAFSDSASRAWNSLLFSMDLQQGDEIITTELEYGNNILSLQSVAERTGAKLIRLPVAADGHLDIDLLKSHLGSDVKLVAVTHAPAHCGSVLNVAEIGSALADHPAFFLVDACQTLGQMSVSVCDIKCDALVATGRKWLRGPRGTAFSYVSDQLATSLQSICVGVANATWREEPENGSHVTYTANAKRFESWERSIAGQLGLGNAIRETLKSNICIEVVQTYRKQIEASIVKNESLALYPSGNSKSGIVTFYSTEVDAAELKQRLAAQHINVSIAGSWLAPWDFQNKQLPDLIRISPHTINSEGEILAVCKAIKNI